MLSYFDALSTKVTIAKMIAASFWVLLPKILKISLKIKIYAKPLSK
jgi:hypothetical protein